MASQNVLAKNMVMLGESLTVHAPLVQAPLGISDGPRLAGAVSRAGGLGCLSVTGGDASALAGKLKRVRAITMRPFSVAFVSQWQSEALLDTCLAADVRAYQVFWWNGARIAPSVRRAGGTVLWQVGDIESAEEALERGAQVLVAQGTQAGGQVRGPHSLSYLVPALRERFGSEIPIIAGGGLATARDVRQVLASGANAALLGTRFLLTKESDAPSVVKKRLVRATSEQLILDPTQIGDWPCAPRRRLQTAGGREHPGLLAGTGLSHMRSVLSAAQVVQRLTPRQASVYLRVGGTEK